MGLLALGAVAISGAASGAAAPASAPGAGRCPPALRRALVTSAQAEPGPGEERRLAPEDLRALRDLLPPPIRENAAVFLASTRGVAIGPCHRVYPVATAYREATRRHGERASLDAAGNLLGYVAGLPFPPDTLDPDTPDAGVRWAWNVAMRYRGAGPAGRFRIVDLSGDGGEQRSYGGSFFALRTSHRADLGAHGHAVPGSERWLFAAGGRFESPFSARHLAWRQLRPRAAEGDASVPDDIFVYVPTLRRPARSATAWVDGLFVPRYTVSGHPGGGIGAGGGFRHLSLERAGAVTEHIRRGLTGLALRPNAYTWRWTDTREVLAPLNARGLCRGGEASRFGPAGLSLAGATWEVRRAVVLEGRARHPRNPQPRLTLYVDHQTQQPLFHIARDAAGAPVEIAILAHRYSGDREGYPPWPGGGDARVFDPVAAVSLGLPPSGESWRRESCDVTSLPRDPRRRFLMTSVSTLSRGR